MGLLVWFTMGLAIWHFSVWVPDRYWGGIVGALVASVIGAMLIGLVVAAARGDSANFADFGTVMAAIPGAVIGLAVSWLIGNRLSEADQQ